MQKETYIMDKKNFIQSKGNLIIVIGIFVVVTIVAIVNGNSGNASGTFDLGETGMTIYGPENYSMSFEFSDIEDISVVEDFVKGSAVSGGTKSGYDYGTWSSSEYPSYEVAALSKVTTVIRVTTNDGGVYIFNFENATTTINFKDSLVEYIESHS